MLTRPEVRRYSSQSGLRDMMIAEKEIVLTFLLQLLSERGIFARLAFKGGTCLRKMFIGSQGRFSTDLDFTSLEKHNHQDVILYDLGIYATRPLDQPLIRRLVVLKLWQAGDKFDPERLMRKFEEGREFDWDDLRDLVRRTEDVDREKICAACTGSFRFLADLSLDERLLANDAHHREHELWDRLRTELARD